MINIPLMRLLNQQLISPIFSSPLEVVDWMGAVQAQEPRAVRWAIGLRMKLPALSAVEQALDEGLIVRTHVMRPTWHIVAAQDLRWMLMLCRESNERIFRSYFKSMREELSQEQCGRAFDVLGDALSGGRSLTVAELEPYFAERNLPHADRQLHAYVLMAENIGLVCSGRLRGTQNTYALIDERIAPQPKLSREEALARLACKYFRSHAPAMLEDFVWWSGLSVTEARRAVALIADELTVERFKGAVYYLHDACRIRGRMAGTVALLPPFDEYLLGYKDRTAVLPVSFQTHAFTNYGIFFPVIMHRGQLVGNWKRTSVRPASSSFPPPTVSFFRTDLQPSEDALAKAVASHGAYLCR